MINSSVPDPLTGENEFIVLIESMVARIVQLESLLVHISLAPVPTTSSGPAVPGTTLVTTTVNPNDPSNIDGGTW